MELEVLPSRFAPMVCLGGPLVVLSLTTCRSSGVNPESPVKKASRPLFDSWMASSFAIFLSTIKEIELFLSPKSFFRKSVEVLQNELLRPFCTLPLCFSPLIAP